MKKYDVVIVGGRCGGASLAIHLARSGYAVCVIDRSPFPSDAISTHGLQPGGVQSLDNLGVLQDLNQSVIPVTSAVFAFDDMVAEVQDLPKVFGYPVLSVRRTLLDATLLEKAAAMGAEVLTRTKVSELTYQAGRVCGVRTDSETIRADLVVGADGVKSTVARLVGAKEYHVTQPHRYFTWAYYEQADTAGSTAYYGKSGDVGILVSPTDGGLTMAATTRSLSGESVGHSDRERAHAEGIEASPVVAAAFDGAVRVGPIRTTTPSHGYFRTSTGPGWALLGDAGHFKDPTLGQGISDAFRQSRRLSEAIVDGRGAPVALDRSLLDWWRWRDADAWDMYWLSHDMGAPGVTSPLNQGVLRHLADRPDLSVDLMRVFNHELSPQKLFTPRLAGAVLLKELVSPRAGRRALIHEALRTSETARLRSRSRRRLKYV